MMSDPINQPQPTSKLVISSIWWLYLGLIVILVLIGLALFSPAREQTTLDQIKTELAAVEPQKILFFYGNTCTHCQVVEDYIADHDLKTILPIEPREVYANQVNAAWLTLAAKQCGLETGSGVGVPLIYSEGQCFSGEIETVDYLKQRWQQVASQAAQQISPGTN